MGAYKVHRPCSGAGMVQQGGCSGDSRLCGTRVAPLRPACGPADRLVLRLQPGIPSLSCLRPPKAT
jgi:hypothetical protein